ncbi:MerR family transcriptional regulator [Actinomycetospora sp. TBRC 11914]|uniref:MerR family transcriptional regulator n=1 Tax=Actinomycetospora sp. TBRC 11914 TaxID=2729387 RepID=UPI00145F200A|nr:MerR family transcriptional regulator [Actinomycetospora sp. TBRC 11914]NMO90690.1 MerR family transcriptional regulator [Actinomycetospora sp. TBRC 11914]
MDADATIWSALQIKPEPPPGGEDGAVVSVTHRSPRFADLPDEGLSIAEAARRSGVSVDTLRYYERTGMMPSPPARTSGGTRRYHAAELDWIRTCTRLRATGMSTERIRRYVELVREGEGNEAQRLELLETHRAEVVAQLESITENLRLIDHKIDVYRERVARGDADGLWSTPR